MPFFNEKNGTLTFHGGLRLWARMSQKELAKQLHSLHAVLPAPESSEVFPCPAFPAMGGMLAPICFFENGKLSAITITPMSIGQRTSLTADQQRAFLFSCVSAKDPSPDTRRSCNLRCGFGHVYISTDPRLGGALLRISYQ